MDWRLSLFLDCCRKYLNKELVIAFAKSNINIMWFYQFALKRGINRKCIMNSYSPQKLA